MCGVLACSSGRLSCFEGEGTLSSASVLRGASVQLQLGAPGGAQSFGVLPQVGAPGGRVYFPQCSVAFGRGTAGTERSSFLDVRCGDADSPLVDAALVAVGGL
mgnify:CR=1 FL=1